MKIVYISVVRDFAMYERCVRGNANCAGGEFVAIDNRERNEGIGIGYNRAIAARPPEEDAWYVFCHEDFELQEPLESRLDSLDRASLWGPIGAATRVRLGLYHQWQLLGLVEECKKDGSARHRVGSSVAEGTPVETFDCQCLIVHSSLVVRHRLRFDERLTFDLYAEDFCIAAHERADIVSRILPLSALHRSGGNVQPRYFEQERYLNGKWRDCCYTGTSSLAIGGNPSPCRRLTIWLKRLVLRKRVICAGVASSSGQRGIADVKLA